MVSHFRSRLSLSAIFDSTCHRNSSTEPNFKLTPACHIWSDFSFVSHIFKSALRVTYCHIIPTSPRNQQDRKSICWSLPRVPRAPQIDAPSDDIDVVLLTYTASMPERGLSTALISEGSVSRVATHEQATIVTVLAA